MTFLALFGGNLRKIVALDAHTVTLNLFQGLKNRVCAGFFAFFIC